MKRFLYLKREVLILFICLAGYSSGSSCTGNDYVVPGYLRCAYHNVAGQNNGGTCVGASGNQTDGCGRAIDDSYQGGTSANEWIVVGGGVGIWLKIEFARKYLINTIRVMQRPAQVEQSKGLKLTFMDGSEAFVELTKNLASSHLSEALWDVRSFSEVMTNFVKVEVETVYTTSDNGFKEIQFYHDNCLKDKQISRFVLPMAKATEILPMSGKTLSLLIQATRGVSIILYEKPKAESARYRFFVFDNDGNSIIYRAAEGGSEILKHSTNTLNALGPDPQRRSVWVDFRSSNLVLGSGGEVLMQWNDPSPISVSYVSVTADATRNTTITVLNRRYKKECFSEADHFWPLDKIFTPHLTPDLIGFKDGTFNKSNFVMGRGNAGFSLLAMKIEKSSDKAIDFGDFPEDCIGDFTRCRQGITIAFWVKLTNWDSDILYTAEKSSDRGITIFFVSATSLLTVKLCSAAECLIVSVKLTPAVWYHVFVAGQHGKNPWMVINGAELFWGTAGSASRTRERHSHLLAGKHPTGGSSNFHFSQLVIWTKALSEEVMRRVFHCVGIQAKYQSCASIEVDDRMPCGWGSITPTECDYMGCCYSDSSCFKQDGHSNYSKLGVGSGSSGEMTASSYSLSFDGRRGRLTWRDPGSSQENTWPKDVWKPRSTTGDQWLQVDLIQVKSVRALATQGYSNLGTSSYCQTYTLSYSKSGATWEPYEENNVVKVFTGNADATAIVKNTITSPFVARKVRVHIKSWSNEPALRVEFYGCTTPVNYMGCYIGGVFKPCGDYDKNSLTPENCTTCCGEAGYSYSAVKLGDQCLCANVVDANKRVGDPRCDVLCAGNPVLRCGGREAYSVYQVLGNYTFPFTLSTPTNVSLSERINATFTSISGVLFTLDLGEGIVLTTQSPTISYLYHLDGAHVVYGQALLGDYGEPQSFFTSLLVNVFSFVKLFECNCPVVVEANVEFGCIITVYEGTSMRLDAQFTNGSAISTPLDDARSFLVGELFQATPGGAGIQTTNKTVLIPNYRFEDDGKLVGWRICSENSGYLSLQVFRPVCGRGFHGTYCYLNGNCDTGLTPCVNATTASCTSSEIFALGSGSCADNNDASENMRASPLSDKYELIAESQVFLSTAGCHIFPFDDITNSTNVKEDDIVGFTYQGSGFAEITSRASGESKQFNVTAFSFTNTNRNVGSILKTRESTPSSVNQIQYSLAAVHRIPSVFWFPHTYPIGHYNEEATISGPWNTVKKNTYITATESVANVTMSLPKAVATNVSFVITVHPHPGYNITYVASYGNEENKTFFAVRADLDQQLSYEYGSSGTYSFSLHASNSLSFSIRTCSVTVQDTVLGLAFFGSILPVALGNVTTIRWFMRQGNGVNITVHFGDGTSFQNGSFEVAHLFAAINNHTYSTVGEYTVIINVTNCVSNASVEGLAVVELPLTGVACDVIHRHRDIEVNETVTVQVTNIQGTNPEIFIDFGDGSVSTSKELSIQHSYLIYNFYNVSCSVYNNVSSVNLSTKIQVHKPVDPLIGFNVTCSHTNLTNLTPCMLNISVGIDFTCTWDWGDGKVSETVFEHLGNYTYHNYTTVGHHVVSLNCSNRLNKTTAVATAIVEEPILGLKVVEPVAKPFAKDFQFIWGAVTGTDPIFNVAITHKISGSSFNLTVTTIKQPPSGSALISADMILDIGIYQLKLTAENYVTPLQTIYLTVMVDVPINNPVLTRSKTFVEVNTTANFTCTMTEGSNVSLLWNFGDGSAVESQSNQGHFPSEGAAVEHVFRREGVYTITLLVNNSVSNFTLHIPIYIQNPHYLVLITNSPQNIPPGTVIFTVTLEPGKEHPTSSNYTVHYGDGTAIADQILSAPLVLEHSYATHGAYVMNITFTNNVHFISLETEVEVQTPITKLQAFSFHTGPVENIGKPGWGPNETYFPCDFPVYFNTSIQTGTNVSYHWNFDDSEEVLTTNTSVNHSFWPSRRYTVKLKAANAVSQVHRELSIDIQCMAKIGSFTNNSPVKLGVPITFSVGIEQVGTASCYLVEIGENVVYSFRMKTPGTCPDACSKVGEEIRPFSDSKRFSFLYTYSGVASYSVNVTACNMVYSMKKTGEAVVTSKPCSNPQVTMNPEITGSTPAEAKSYNPWRQVSITNKITINCEASNTTAFSWKVCTMLKHNERCVPYRLPGSVSVLGAQLDLPKYLPYGYYCMHFTCVMVGAEGIQNSSYGCIRFIPSKLEAAIDGGDSRSIGLGKTAVIGSYDTYDRDVEKDKHNPSNFTRCWFCAKHDSYDQDTVNDCFNLTAFPLTPILQLRESNSSSNSTLSNSTLIDENGCFGFPPGRLNASTPEISFSTLMMGLGKKYDVCMLAMKDTRKRFACTTIEIVEGDPPKVEINCANSVAPNCKRKITPSEKLALQGKASCDSCIPIFTAFEWKISKSTIAGVWEELTQIDGMLTTSLTGQTLAVKADVLTGDATYKFRLESWDSRGGARGYSEYAKVVNRPPYDGSCEVQPTLGYLFQEAFEIKCHGWQDDTKLTYSVTAQVDSDQPETLIPADAVLDAGKDYVTQLLELPVGKKEKDFWIDVFVKIKDEDGASHKYPLKAQVKMPEQSEEETDAMISGQFNKVDSLLTVGDTAAVLSAVGNIAAAMSAPSEVEPSGQSGGSAESSQEEQKKVAERKEKLLAAIFQVSLPSNPESAVQIASALTAVSSGGPSTISLNAKNKMADAVINVASALENDMGSQQRTELAKNLVGPIGTLVAPDAESSDESSSSERNSSTSSETQKKALQTNSKLLDSLVGCLLPGEEPMIVEGESLSLGAAVNPPTEMKAMTVGRSSVTGLEAAVDKNSTEPVQSQMSVFKQNPFGGAVNSGVAQLELKDRNGNTKNVSNLTTLMDIFITAEDKTTKPIPRAARKGDLLVTNLNVTDNMSAIHVWVAPEDNNTQIVILGRKNVKPSLQEYDVLQTVPRNLESKHASEVFNSSDASDRFQLFIDNDDLNQTAAGLWYFAFYYNGSLREKDQESAPEAACFNTTILQVTCKYLNTTSMEWQCDGCKPGPKTTLSLRHCRCNHLTSFASDFFVPPNKIDWDKISFTELLKNPLVFSFVCGIFGLYFLLVFWARRADRKDLEKVGVAPLPDNDPRDTYIYEIVVYTGFANHSGTTSEVRMVLVGGLDETSPRRLKDPEPNRKKFCRGNVDYFLLSVPQCLGKLKSLRIWHDNKGDDPSWYLLRIMVHDVQNDIKTWFICDRWLAVEEDDGMVERTLTPASKEELTSFNLLFSTEARKNLMDNHLWFSVVARPAKSNFTRVQRLSCCLSVLLSTMLANAMFYQVGDESSTGTSVHVGPFSFSVKQLSIGITSSLVVLPANVLIVMFFRKARPSEAKVGLDKSQDPNNQSPKYELSGDKPKEESKLENEEEEDTDKNKNKKKKKKTLPHYFVYISYGLVFVTCTVSATFTVFYGLTFGKEKSEGWLSSMMISFWQDVLISQPLKVFAAAMFFAVVIKDPNKAEEENEQENNELNPDEEALHSKKQNSEEEKGLRKIGFVDKPPNPAKLEAARQLKTKQRQMRTIIREVVQYFVFLSILLVIAYGSRDPMAFPITTAMHSFFDEGTYSGNNGIDGVADYKSYWNWVEETFIPTLMPRFWYGPFAIDEEVLVKQETTTEEVTKEKNKKLKKTKISVSNVEAGFNVLYTYDAGFVADHCTAALVGTARLRQLRIIKGKCVLIPFLASLFYECNVPYDWDKEESKAFLARWVPLGSNISVNEPTPWTYQTQWALKGTPYWGMFATYWGGGYVADFGDDRTKALKLSKQLKSLNWIDRYTRALFAEFTVYNAQTNFFSVITLLTEILPTGGYYHSPKIQTLRLYRYVGPEMVFVVACEITYMAFLLYFLYKQIKKYRQERKEFFRNPWNYSELLVLGFSLSAVGLYFARLAITKYIISNMHKTPGKFVSFQYVAFIDEWVSATTAFAVFFSFLKFVRLLKFNRRVSTLIQTIKLAAKPLSSFLLMFFILFLAYCQFAFLVFGGSNDDYASFPTTMGSLMSMTLGSFDFHALTDSSRILGPFFFFTYVVSVFFVLMNVFIGILNDALSDVANDVSIQSNEHEILDFMFHTFKKTFGKQVGPAIKPSYKEPKNQFELNVDSIEELSENVEYALRNICMEDIRHTTWFEPENASRKKKIMMTLVLETDEDFTENDICDNIPLFDEEMKKYDEKELIRKLIYFREKKRLEEEASQLGDDQSDKSSEDESENDSNSDDDNASVPSGDSDERPINMTLTADSLDDNELFDQIERHSPRPATEMKLLNANGSSEV